MVGTQLRRGGARRGGMMFMPPAGGYHSLEPNHSQPGEGPKKRATQWPRGNGRLERLFPLLPSSTNELEAQRSPLRRATNRVCDRPPVGPPLSFLPASPRQQSLQPIARRVESHTHVAALLYLTRLFFTLEAGSQWGVELPQPERGWPGPALPPPQEPQALTQTHCACAQPGPGA